MTAVTWSDVADASATWREAFGYVFVDYVVDDYVIGYEPSGSPWTDTSDAATSWSGL